MKKLVKFFIYIGVLACAYLFYKFYLSHHITLENVKYYIKDISFWTQKNYITSVFLYMLIYFIVVVFALPATILVVMVGGFLFGTFESVLYSTISATLGATVTFLFFRSFSRATIEKKYASRLATFKKGLDEHGAFYLLSVHFMVVVPFFIINILAAVAGVGLWTFVWTTFIGFLPCAFVCSFAGRNLLSIQSVHDVFSWEIILGIVLLVLVGILPIIFKKLKKYKKSLEGIK